MSTQFFEIINFQQAFVRESCKASLDVQVPLTWQPEDKIQTIIDSCVQQFHCESELARKRIGTFLKNCRKTEKRKVEGRTASGHQSNNRKAKKAKKVNDSPWAVVTLRVFLHYNCPACDYKCKTESSFIEHACEYHPESVDFLYSIELEQDVDDDDYREDFDGEEEGEEEFDAFPWNANAIVDIKEEDRELNFNQMVDEAEDEDKDLKPKVKHTKLLDIKIPMVQ